MSVDHDASAPTTEAAANELSLKGAVDAQHGLPPPPPPLPTSIAPSALVSPPAKLSKRSSSSTAGQGGAFVPNGSLDLPPTVGRATPPKPKSKRSSSGIASKPSSSASVKVKDAAFAHEGEEEDDDDDDQLLVTDPEPPAGPVTAYGRPPPTLAARKPSSSSSLLPGATRDQSQKDKDKDKLVEKMREACRESIRTVVGPLLGGDDARARAFARELEERVWVAEDGGSERGRKKYLCVILSSSSSPRFRAVD